MNSRGGWALGLGAVLLIGACGPGDGSGAHSASLTSGHPGPVLDEPVPGQPYPELCLLDTTGNEVRLSDFADRPVLIESVGMT